MHSNLLKVELIVKECQLALPEPADDWRTWAGNLSPNDANSLRGSLIARFGRVTLKNIPDDPQSLALAYLSGLEHEVEVWLGDPLNLIDFFIATDAGDIVHDDELWYWSRADQKLLDLRATAVSTLPKGVRVLPLLEQSREGFEQHHVCARLQKFFDTHLTSGKYPGDIVVWTESGCKLFADEIPSRLSIWLKPLISLRSVTEKGKAALHRDVSSALQCLQQFEESLPSDAFSQLSVELARIRSTLHAYLPRPPMKRYELSESSMITGPYTAPWGEVG